MVDLYTCNTIESKILRHIVDSLTHSNAHSSPILDSLQTINNSVSSSMV